MKVDDSSEKGRTRKIGNKESRMQEGGKTFGVSSLRFAKSFRPFGGRSQRMDTNAGPVEAHGGAQGGEQLVPASVKENMQGQDKKKKKKKRLSGHPTPPPKPSHPPIPPPRREQGRREPPTPPFLNPSLCFSPTALLPYSLLAQRCQWS